LSTPIYHKNISPDLQKHLQWHTHYIQNKLSAGSQAGYPSMFKCLLKKKTWYLAISNDEL
jgi:hypothetical protein